MDPILLRGIERIVIALGAVCFAYLGYRLYQAGVTRGKTQATVHSPLLKFALSGTGPGLFFMAFGAAVLVSGLATGGASTTITETVVREIAAGEAEETVERRFRPITREVAEIRQVLQTNIEAVLQEFELRQDHQFDMEELFFLMRGTLSELEGEFSLVSEEIAFLRERIEYLEDRINSIP